MGWARLHIHAIIHAMNTVELFQSLTDAGVDYVLVGGLAVQLHGYMRSTFDVDLVLAMNDDNLARFIDVAKRHGLTPGIPVPIESLRDAAQIERWHREKGMLAFSLREPQIGGGVVDVIVRPEVSFECLMANAVADRFPLRQYTAYGTSLARPPTMVRKSAALTSTLTAPARCPAAPWDCDSSELCEIRCCPTAERHYEPHEVC